MKNYILQRNNTSRLIFFSCVFSFFCVLSYFFVPVSDDIFFFHKFGANIKDAFFNALFYGNGRVLGNFVEIIIQRFILARIVLIAAVLTWLISLIIRLSGLKNTRFYFFPLFFTVSLHPNFFAGSIHWMAAFCNYIIPLAMFLEILYCTLNYENIRCKKATVIMSCFLSFAACFFSENTTVVFVFVFLSVCIINFVKTKKFNLLYTLIVAFSFLGMILMFIFPGFVGKAHTMDNYRHWAFGNGIVGTIKFVFGQAGLVSKFISSVFIVMFVITLFTMLIMKRKNPSIYGKCKILFAIQFIALLYCFFDVVLIQRAEIETKIIEYLLITARIIVVLLYFIIAFLCALIYENKVTKTSDESNLLLWFVGVAISTLPLVIIDPIGYRLAFMPFVFLCIIACTLLNTFICEYSAKKSVTNILPNIVAATALIICSSLLIIFVKNHNSYYERDAYIKEEVHAEKAVIVLPELTFPEYVCVSREDYIWPIHYGYDKDSVSFIFVPREKWLEYTETEQ